MGSNNIVGLFHIPFRLPSLNEVIRTNRNNKYSANKKKQELQADISKYIEIARNCKTLAPVNERVIVDIQWFENSNRRDADNVKSANKFVLDALVKRGILENDSPRFVKDVIGAVHYPMDGYNGPARVEVYLYKAERKDRQCQTS